MCRSLFVYIDMAKSRKRGKRRERPGVLMPPRSGSAFEQLVSQIVNLDKDIAAGLYGAPSSAVGAATGKGWLYPGSRYIGPGNPNNNGKPTSYSDELAYVHDHQYSYLQRLGVNPYTTFNQADREMLANVDTTKPGGWAIYLGINAKRIFPNDDTPVPKIPSWDQLYGDAPYKYAKGTFPTEAQVKGVPSKPPGGVSGAGKKKPPHKDTGGLGPFVAQPGWVFPTQPRRRVDPVTRLDPNPRKAVSGGTRTIVQTIPLNGSAGKALPQSGSGLSSVVQYVHPAMSRGVRGRYPMKWCRTRKMWIPSSMRCSKKLL